MLEKRHEISIWERPGFHLQKVVFKSCKTINKCNISKKYKILHSTPLSKLVFEKVIYPMETIKVRLGQGLDLTSKSWLCPNNPT